HVHLVLQSVVRQPAPTGPSLAPVNPLAWPTGLCPGGGRCPGRRGGPLHWQDGGMERVIGIGGYFMRAADPQALGAWYRDCLGLDLDENGLWRPGAGPTVFAT